MTQAYDDQGVADVDADREQMVDEACTYLSNIQSQLVTFERDLKKLKTVVNKDDLALAITEAPPSRNLMKCPNFSGNSADRLTFKFGSVNLKQCSWQGVKCLASTSYQR